MAAKYTNKLKVQDKFTCVLKDTCSGSPFWHFGCHVVVVVFCLFVCLFVFYASNRVCTSPGKSWNFILAFSRTFWSWKSINSCNEGFFKTNFLQYYFWISIL